MSSSRTAATHSSPLLMPLVAPVLFLVYLTAPGQTISQETLRSFRRDVLDRDDVFVPPFGNRLVFYGSNEEDLKVTDDAAQELSAWNVRTWTFVVPGDAAHKVAPGPYVFANKQVWQPWKVYHDFNVTFMSSFKPSATHPGG